MAICPEIRGDSCGGADHRPRWYSASSLYATTYVCATSKSGKLFIPAQFVYPEEEQGKVSAQLSVSFAVSLTSFAFLRFEPAIISLDINKYTQWLS